MPVNQPRQVGQGSGFEEWYNGLPKVTKFWGTGIVLVRILIAINQGLLQQIYLDYGLLARFHIWRLVTNYFFCGMGIDFLMGLYFVVYYGRKLEEEQFGPARIADFVYMLTLGATTITIVNYFFGFPFLGSALNFMMIYIWCRRNAHMKMNLFGLFTYGAAYHPWVLIGISMMMGGTPVVALMGIFAGHMYHFFEDIYPLTGGKRYLQTPLWFTNLFQPYARPANTTWTGAHNWGRGQALGADGGGGGGRFGGIFGGGGGAPAAGGAAPQGAPPAQRQWGPGRPLGGG